MEKLIKQTVYLPVKEANPEENCYLQDLNGDFYLEQKGYFFTPEQLNEYTQTVIKQALETAAEKAESYIFEEDGETCSEVRKQSITNTFEQTYKKFEV